MKVRATQAGGVSRQSRAIRQRLTAAVRHTRDGAHGHVLLTAAITVTSIGGAAALIVTLPDPTHVTAHKHAGGGTTGRHPATQHLARPHAHPQPSAGHASHTTSSPS